MVVTVAKNDLEFRKNIAQLGQQGLECGLRSRDDGRVCPILLSHLGVRKRD
jgi:hypothetical protein